MLSATIIAMMEARCGHLEEKIFADVHHGLCRKCHSSFAFLLELEEKYGEDALIDTGIPRYLPIHHQEEKNGMSTAF